MSLKRRFQSLQDRAEDIGMVVGLYLLDRKSLPLPGESKFVKVVMPEDDAYAPLKDQLATVEREVEYWEGRPQGRALAGQAKPTARITVSISLNGVISHPPMEVVVVDGDHVTIEQPIRLEVGGAPYGVPYVDPFEDHSW